MHACKWGRREGIDPNPLIKRSEHATRNYCADAHVGGVELWRTSTSVPALLSGLLSQHCGQIESSSNIGRTSRSPAGTRRWLRSLTALTCRHVAR